MWPSGLTLAMTLTLNFQGPMRNWLYLCQKWSDCHETKSKHINWTLGLKCDHQIWPWPWPWPWIFKVKYGICYISTKSGPITTKQKANISIWTLGLKCDNGFDLGHDIDVWIFKVICDLDHLVTNVRCKDLPDSDRGDFRCRRAVDSSSLHVIYECSINMINVISLVLKILIVYNDPRTVYICTLMSCNSLLANVVCFTCTTLNKVHLILSYLISSHLILRDGLCVWIMDFCHELHKHILPTEQSPEPNSVV